MRSHFGPLFVPATGMSGREGNLFQACTIRLFHWPKGLWFW